MGGKRRKVMEGKEGELERVEMKRVEVKRVGMRRVEMRRVEMKKEEVKRVGVRQWEERGMRAQGLAEGYKRDRTRRETSGLWRGVGSIWGGSRGGRSYTGRIRRIW